MNSSPGWIVLDTAIMTSCAVAGMAVWRGHVEASSGWKPVDAISHIVWGPAAGSQRECTLRYTGLGLLLNGVACAFWSWLYERRRRFTGGLRTVVSDALYAIGTSAFAYVTDYHVVPRRFTPGFELILPRRSFPWLYGALALGLMIPTWFPLSHGRKGG